MAKQLENITMFYKGDPAAGTPTTAFLSYGVADGNLRKKNQIYEVPSPTWTDSPNAVWTAAITQIKTNEGIA